MLFISLAGSGLLHAHYLFILTRVSSLWNFLTVTSLNFDDCFHMQARDLPKLVQAGYHLIPYFIFSPQEGVSTMFRF